jgi:hypothetical protein
VSNTPAATMQLQWSKDRAEMMRRNIVFQEEGPSQYVAAILGGRAT